MSNDQVTKLIYKNLLLNDINITDFDVSNMNLTHEDVIQLAEGLKKNTYITRLILNGNPLEKISIEILANAICENFSLDRIEIKSTRIDQESLNIIINAVKKRAIRKPIKLIYSDGNQDISMKIIERKPKNSNNRLLSKSSSGYLKFGKHKLKKNLSLNYIQIGYQTLI